MITYAESIQRPNAEIFQGNCSLPMKRCTDYIEQKIDANEFRTHEVYSRAGTPIVDTRFRDSKAIVPRHDEELAYYLFEAVQGYFTRAFSPDPGDALVLAQAEFFHYSPGVGLKMHSDDHATGSDGKLIKVDSQRGITAILYLNSDFKGGEIHFPKQRATIKPEAGMVLIFPSNKNFPHQVNPITSGHRISYQRIYGIMSGRSSFVAEADEAAVSIS